MTSTPQINWPKGVEAHQLHMSFDFIDTLSQEMKEQGISQKMLADRLKVSEGRISQIMSNPGNFTLKKMVEWAHAVGVKPSVVLYDDEDPNYERPPVYPAVFVKLWQILGKPKSFSEVQLITSLCSDCFSRKTLHAEMKDLGLADKNPAKEAKVYPLNGVRTVSPQWKTPAPESDPEDNQLPAMSG